jgi:uncharacterized membrane protein YuzA (DUF378 family)
MKLFDVLAAILLVIGGLNWGLYGLFDLDLVAATTGSATSFVQFVYAAVGLAALYQVIRLRSIQRRWNFSAARVN